MTRLKWAVYALFSLSGFYLFHLVGAVACAIAIPLAADVGGALLIQKYHPTFLAAAENVSYREAFNECDIVSEDLHFVIRETRGIIRHWMLNPLPTDTVCCVMAPKREYVVIAKKRCTIFPPASLDEPMTYHYFDAGTLDVYYTDISTIELRDRVITLATSGGKTISYTDHSGAANEAVNCLREKVRTAKAR